MNINIVYNIIPFQEVHLNSVLHKVNFCSLEVEGYSGFLRIIKINLIPFVGMVLEIIVTIQSEINLIIHNQSMVVVVVKNVKLYAGTLSKVCVTLDKQMQAHVCLLCSVSRMITVHSEWVKQ